MPRLRDLGSLALTPCLLALLSGGCSTQPDQVPSVPPELVPPAEEYVTLDPSVESKGLVQSVTVARASLPQLLEVTGRIGVDENRTVRVGALTSGRVTEVLANVGDRVKSGQALARLRTSLVDDVRSDYVKAVAELDRRQAELEFSQGARDRAARLHQLKAGSLQQLERREADLRLAERSVRVVQAEMGRIREHLRHLGLTTEGALEEYGVAQDHEAGHFEGFELIQVLSPRAGMVLERMVTPGTVVTPSDDLFVISDLSRVWVDAEVPEDYLASLKEGQAVEISVQAYRSQVFPGRLTYIADRLNPRTRRVRVLCETPNPGGQLKLEMYATVRLEFEQAEESMVVPSRAVQMLGGRKVVFVEMEQNRFAPRSIVTGRMQGEMIEVMEGLEVGQKVVDQGSFLIKSELLKGQLVEEE